MTAPLQKAAQAVIASITDDAWIEAYEELRKALDAEIAQSVEPVAYRAWFDKDHGARWLFTLWPEEEQLQGINWEPLYLHPPQPQATTPAPELLEELENCRDLLEIAFPDAPVDSCIGVGIIKASVAIAAAQGEKP